MNKVSKRAWIILIAALVILSCTVLFFSRYMSHAEEWVTFPGSPHLYSGINPDIGTVQDGSGLLLLDATGDRTYSEDLWIRQSTLHLLGDRQGFIESPLLGNYAESMISYDPVWGLEISEELPSAAQLTISAEVQKTALTALAGRKGTVGVYNYKTGEILCAVTSPTFDPDNIPDIAGDTTGLYDGVYVNRFFRSSYTPGSVFKTLTATAALAEIEAVESMTFLCEGETIIDGERIVCAGYHGYQDLATALRNSCNVAFGELTVLLGAETMTEYAEMAGINSSLSFDGIRTAAGSFDVSKAGAGSLAWAGVGQYTDLVNPCQFMTFMGMLANDGEAAQPYIMQRITAEDGVTYEAQTTYLQSGLDPAVTRNVAAMMRDNVVYVYGTGQFPDVTVCAKSGTAETAEGKSSTALFSGFVQDDTYPLAFIVVVEEGGTGASAAAPIAGQTIAACIEYLDSKNSIK